MTTRPEVVALLTDFDVERTSSGQRFVHRDGRPFTPEEADLIASATDEDMRAAARELAATPERLTGVLMPYLRKVAEGMGDGEPTALDGVPLEGLPGDREAKPQDQPDARRVGQQSRLRNRVAVDYQQVGELPLLHGADV
ncbi:MAG: hypothetical protein J2P30_24000, partial [Actinobacteria bacterium]|nr:hypothetical protein [Actinomycetota bacterium]